MIRISAFAALGVLLLAASACQPGELAQSRLSDVAYAGSIRISLAHPTDATKTSFDLVFAAASSVSSMVVCSAAAGMTPAQCVSGAPGYMTTTKIDSANGKNFFKAEAPLVLAEGIRILVVGTGLSADARFIEFGKPGATTSTTTTTSTTSTTTAPPANETKGTGGKTGQFENNYGQSRYMANVPADVGPTKSYGLLVLLHGSTASNYDQFVQMMSDVAAKNGLIPVSVLAPNGQGWNEGDETENAKFLDDLVQKELFAKYNVNKAKVFFSGQSSGGGFLSEAFVPQYSQNYQGGAFLLCGAAPPKNNFAPSEATKKNFRLYFDITTEDPIWPESYKQAVQVYTQAGMTIRKDDTKPGGHCEFDQAAIVAQELPNMLK